MNVVFHVYHHVDPAFERRLEQMIETLIQKQQEKIMATLDDLVAKVANISTVEDSVIALLTDIAARLKEAGQDQAKLDALAAAIDDQTKKLSDAVVANTPAA